jgi:hypothetical protein
MEGEKMIEFKKKVKEDSSNWVKQDPSKPFETCQDLGKLPPEVLAKLEEEGYDEDDTSKTYKFIIGDYTYRFSVFQDEWQCSRWKTGKSGGGSKPWGGKAAAGPREWSYLKMVDFEIGNLNDLREIVQKDELEEGEQWELVPFFETTAKGEPMGIIRKLQRISMIGSATKENGKEE